MTVYTCFHCDREFGNEKYLMMHLALHVNKLGDFKSDEGMSRPVSHVTRGSGVARTSTNISITLNNTELSSLNGGGTVESSNLSQPHSVVTRQTRRGKGFSQSTMNTRFRRHSIAKQPAVADTRPVLSRLKTAGVGGDGGLPGVAGGYPEWTCDECGKKFAQNSNYKNHIRTHSNQRP